MKIINNPRDFILHDSQYPILVAESEEDSKRLCEVMHQYEASANYYRLQDCEDFPYSKDDKQYYSYKSLDMATREAIQWCYDALAEGQSDYYVFILYKNEPIKKVRIERTEKQFIEDLSLANNK